MTVKKAGNKARTKTPSGKIRNMKPHSREHSESSAAASGGSKPALTYEQIAERAKAIWRERGCMPGCDEQNWHEAEAQLKEELQKV